MYRKPDPASLAQGIIRESDGAFVPADPRNADWQAYQAWLAAKNAPDAPERPPVAAEPRNGGRVL